MALAASQVMGVVISRKIVRPALVTELPLDRLVAAVGPTVQRYLTGDIGEIPDVGAE